MNNLQHDTPTVEQVNTFLRSCGYTNEEISWKDENPHLRALECGYRQGWKDRGTARSDA